VKFPIWRNVVGQWRRRRLKCFGGVLTEKGEVGKEGGDGEEDLFDMM